MAKISSRRATASKPKKQTLRHRSKRVRKSNAAKRGEENWDEFKEKLTNALRNAVNCPAGIKLAPYKKPDSVLKRMIYEYIMDHLKNQTHDDIFAAINEDDDDDKFQFIKYNKSLRVKPEHNPFYGAFSRINRKLQVTNKGNDLLDRSKVSRYAGQLLYALRHSVPPEYLIGFLYQSGNPTYIAQQVKDQYARESWYNLNQ